jgi:hypothetical protein
MVAELSVVPAVIAALVTGHWPLVVAGAVTAVAVAERGRRRWGGTSIFPFTASLFAPLWIGERGVCAWLAVWRRVTLGGVPYAGTVLSKAANSPRRIRRRLLSAACPPPPSTAAASRSTASSST